MDKKTKARIISAARKISRWHKPRLAAKKKAQVDKALFLCQMCGCLSYEGKSKVRHTLYKQQYKKYVVKHSRPHMDHIDPVVDPKTGFPELSDGWPDFNIYFKRMFCEESNFACLCEDCHKEKSKEEMKIRAKNRKSKSKK